MCLRKYLCEEKTIVADKISMTEETTVFDKPMSDETSVFENMTV